MDKFTDWFRYFSGQFANVKKWIDEQPDPKAQIASWQKALSDCEHEFCVAAVDGLKSGEFDRPFSNDDWPKEIRRIAKQLRSEAKLAARMDARATRERKYTSGQRTYRCLTCQDSGMVNVVHLNSYKAAREKGTDAVLQTCSVPCNCNSGREFAEMKVVIGGKKTERNYHDHVFDPEKFFPTAKIQPHIVSKVDWKLPTRTILNQALDGQIEIREDIGPFLEWLAEFDQRKTSSRSNYVPEFSEF